MTKYREILRLASLGLSQQSIADSSGVSKKTVNRVLKRAKELDISWPLEPNETDAILADKFFPSAPKQISSKKRMPDFNYIRKELLRNGVNKKLLWTEYLEECRQSGEEPLMYSQFCYYIQQDEQKRRATMHINRKPGEQIEVDWAGDPAKIIDPDTGEIIPAFLFVGVMTYSQYPYVEAAKNKGYDVLLMDCQLDAHFVNLLETKIENSRFARVDSDSIDNLILKEERIRPEMSEQDKSDIDVIFKSLLPAENSYYVTAENLGENASPILITQSEFMRRYREMSSLGGGMNFYSEMPESYNITVNMQNPLILKVMGAKAEAFAGKTVEDPVKDLPKDATEEQKKEAQSKKDAALEERRGELREFAGKNEILKQITDLALLANGMLKGKDLSDFIARSRQVVADAYLK